MTRANNSSSGSAVYSATSAAWSGTRIRAPAIQRTTAGIGVGKKNVQIRAEAHQIIDTFNIRSTSTGMNETTAISAAISRT